MNCIDLTSKRSKMFSYFAKHSKQRKTTKVIKLQWIPSIWHYFAKHSKQRKTTKVIKLQWIASIWHYFAKHSKQRRTTKVIKLQWIASILHQNNQKCWVTSWNIQNYAKLRKSSNYNEFHRLDVKTSNQRRTTKVILFRWICIDLTSKRSNSTQIYESHQITMNCIDLTSNDLKCSVTSQNIQNNAKLQKWSNYNELHRFDVKTI